MSSSDVLIGALSVCDRGPLSIRPMLYGLQVRVPLSPPFVLAYRRLSTFHFCLDRRVVNT